MKRPTENQALAILAAVILFCLSLRWTQPVLQIPAKAFVDHAVETMTKIGR